MAIKSYTRSNVTPSAFMNDTVTTGNQYLPAVAANADGSRYFGSWSDPNNDFADGRVVGADGTPVTSQFLVNSTGINEQFDTSVVGLSNGNFVVMFTDFSVDPGGDIRARIFNSNGVALGSDFLVNGASNDDGNSDVTALSNGGFAVAWQRDFGGGDIDIRVRLHWADGTPIGSLITVDSASAINTNSPSIAGLAGGGFVVACTQTPATGGDSEVWFQRCNAAGVAQGGHVLIDTFGSINTDIQVQALEDGGFAVAYTDNGWAIDQTEITFQVFNADGSARSLLIRANTVTAGAQSLPSITTLPNGFIVVSWKSGQGLCYQAFDPNGNAIGSNFAVSGSVVEGEIAGLTGGLVANVRSSTVPDGDGNSIRHSIDELTRTISGDGTGESLVGDALRDSMNGGGGNDLLYGRANADTLQGGAGNDVVNGGLGSDQLFGGSDLAILTSPSPRSRWKARATRNTFSKWSVAERAGSGGAAPSQSLLA